MGSAFTRLGSAGAYKTIPSAFNLSKRYVSRQEGITGPAAGVTATLVDISGAGIMDAFWFAAADTAQSFDYILEFFVDGEVTPSISIDAGTLFLYTRGSQITTSSTVATDHMTCSVYGSTNGGAGVLKFPVPYTNGLRIDVTGATGSAASRIWSQAYYTEMSASDVPAYRLKGTGLTWIDRVALLSGDTYSFLDVSGAGVFVWHGICGSLGTNYSWLERDITVTVDSEVTPAIQSTGLEDWFLGSHYFLGTPYGVPEACVSAKQTATIDYGVNMGVDLLALCGGIPFSTRLQLDMGTEAAATSGHSMSWLALYYLAV